MQTRAIAVLGLSLALVAPASAVTLRFDAALFRAELSGSYASFDPDAGLPSLDLESDLGITDAGNTPAVRLTLLRNRQVLVIDYLDFGGDGSQQSDIDIEGVPLPAQVDASVDFRSLRLAYAYAVVVDESAYIGIELGLQQLEAEGRVTVTEDVLGTFSVSRSDDRSETGPVAGADVQLRFTPNFETQGRLSYAWLPLSDRDITFLDAEVSAAYRIGGMFWLRAGYRWLDIDVDDDEFNLDVTTQGPFAGITLRR